MRTPEEQFDCCLRELRINPESSRALHGCIEALRDMKGNPAYRLGEKTAALHDCILRLSAESGMSYESLWMRISGPRIG